MEIMGLINSIIGIITSFTLAVAAIIGVNNYVTTENRKKIESAIELAKYYKDKILNNITAICDLYCLCGIDKIIEKLDNDKMIKFDEEEAKELLGDHVQEILSIDKKPDFTKKVITISKIYNLDIYGTKEFNSTENDKVIVKASPEIVQSSVNDIISDILNSLEYFAMNFNYNVADENNVYQSLSQTYVKVVKYLYVHIARNNKRASGQKYYTNVIKLFKLWSDKMKEDNDASKNINLERKTNKV